MSEERYNARTAEVHWQWTWQHAGLLADPVAPHTAAVLGLAEVRRHVIADIAARFRRARGAATAGVCAAAHPLLRALAITAGADTIAGADAASRDDDLAGLVDAYGADATRWCLLSAPAGDRCAAATAAGIHGAWRFVHRLWRVVNTAAQISPPAGATHGGTAARTLRVAAHRTLARVTENLDTGRPNLAAAGIHGFARTLQRAVTEACATADPDLKNAVGEAAGILVPLFHPMMPHLAEECWAALGHRELLAFRSWSVADGELLMADTVTLPVHVDGRRRAEVAVARDAPTGDIAASVLALGAIRRALAGRAPRKVIIVPQRIINVVA